MGRTALVTVAPGDRILVAYADDEAPAWLAKVVLRHLERCVPCRSQAAAHERILQALSLSATATEKQVLSQMAADGRARLLLSMDGTPPAQLEPDPNGKGEAELIFGCRHSDDYLSDHDVTLASMYDALLGSRAGGTHGGR
ncbi:MAG: zf-HC2 domain-containing protein [Bryobacterales bacterium]|nr:zf-HC2 domain-containing protein [Bryobacterales bacterium]